MENKILPTDDEERKQIPLYTGLIKYFPDALIKVAQNSYKGSMQHHPDTGIWWDKTKSKDELDALMRHLFEEDWAAVAWRALAQLQRECDNDKQG
nr:hypothetical protein [uncultured Mediterranean phage uvMED]